MSIKATAVSLNRNSQLILAGDYSQTVFRTITNGKSNETITCWQYVSSLTINMDHHGKWAGAYTYKEQFNPPASKKLALYFYKN